MDANKILNIILSECYNATTADDLLVYDSKNGRFIVAGVTLPPERSQQIIEAAHELDNNILFQFLLRDAEYDGTRRMAIKASNWEETIFPKADLYVAKLFRDKVDEIKGLVINKPEKVDKKVKK